MEPLPIAAYSLIALADIQILLTILLIIIAILTDRQLGHRSNIMIPFLFLPDVVRVLISNIDTVESIEPDLLNLSNAVCLATRWGLMCCYSGTMWLLLAITVHRYLLCVKMRVEINSTKISLAVSLATLIASISGTAALVVFAKWDIISDDTSQQNVTQLSKNDILPNPPSVDTKGSVVGSDPRNKACVNRQNVMHTSTSFIVISALAVYVIPTIIQMYYYWKIYLHLKQQQERFASNHQVVTRLYTNSQATVRTAFTSFSSHFLVVVLSSLVTRFVSSMEVAMVLQLLLSNAVLATMISSLFLHGGYR